MSHQSGIVASPELQAFFAKAKRPASIGTRLIQVAIEHETLVLKHHIDTPVSPHHQHQHHQRQEQWADEYDKLLLPLLDEKTPSYFFFRTDQQDADGSYRWLFVLWSPDTASIRDKMLYAATKATLKRIFGEGYIAHELFGTQRNDVNMKAYTQARRSSSSGNDDSLTLAEHELRAMRLNESMAAAAAAGHHHQHGGNSHVVHSEMHVSRVHVSKSHATPKHQQHETSVLHNVFNNAASPSISTVVASPARSVTNNADVAFPVSEDAVRAISEFNQQRRNYLQLSLDLLNEKILLEELPDAKVAAVQPAQLIRLMPRNRPRYHLYRFSHHTDDGSHRHEPVLFIYSIPSDFSACPAKERMLYSSCKGPLIEQLQYAFRVQIDKKLETSSDDFESELNEVALRLLFSTSAEDAARATHAVDARSGRAQTKFDKPQGPVGERGPRRLVR